MSDSLIRFLFKFPSETCNYIHANTKDCPKCHIYIEKNGGCNHMQCTSCKFDFCWMCLGDWKAHGSEYYECSRYKENPNIANDSATQVHLIVFFSLGFSCVQGWSHIWPHILIFLWHFLYFCLPKAREALKKYLHYYERWENHSKSLQLEQQTLERLKARINDKVMKGMGSSTWIDYQFFFTSASMLAKCRYTLQYTYPFAYYMEPGPRKDLFEYQQVRIFFSFPQIYDFINWIYFFSFLKSQLEAEIENLSWQIERAEQTDRGDIENQMDVCEKRRTTLLKDFFPIVN